MSIKSLAAKIHNNHVWLGIPYQECTNEEVVSARKQEKITEDLISKVKRELFRAAWQPLSTED